MPPLVQRRNAPEAYGLRGGSEPDLTCGDAGGQGAGDREPVRPALYRRPFTRNVPRPICDPTCGTVILWAAGSVRLCRYLGAQCAADNEANRAVTTNLLLWWTQTYNDLVERPRAGAHDGALYRSRPLQRRVRYQPRRRVTQRWRHVAPTFPEWWPSTPIRLTKMYHQTRPQAAPRATPEIGTRTPGQS